MAGITIVKGKGRKLVLRGLGPIFVPVNMGIIEYVPQYELQGEEGQGQGQKFIHARRRFTSLANIRSLMSLSPKAKARV